jgi:DNA repair protein RecO (recombination protein O)
MPSVVTESIVLHVFDYLESSRILKLVTREAGVRSVLARGARRSKRRFGAALDLFAQGTAELQVKSGRDLDTLSAFDVARARPALGADLARFAGAGVVAELTLGFARDDADPALFDAVASALDDIAAAPSARARETTLASAWRILAALGVAPAVDICAECHAPVAPDAAAAFSHPSGGTLCERCGRLARAARVLPAEARAALRDWLRGEPHAAGDADARAHQRLLREFVREHLADERPLPAFEVWEHAAWASSAADGGDAA